MNKTYPVISFALIIVLLLFGCDKQYTPKPKGYFRIDLPEKGYQKYSSLECPFEFEYPTYAEIIRDSLFFGEKTENPCWLNVYFKQFGGKIHLSYKEIGGNNSLATLIEDAHKMTFKHSVKAEYIDESVISNPNHVSGILYQVGGNAASNVQFFVTDSIHHYLRGALYFNSIPNEDSLSPVINFVEQDLLHLISTLKWVDH